MEISIGNLKLSAQRSLLKNVFPNLRAVCINEDCHLIRIYFYYENNLSEEELYLCKNTVNQLKEDFQNQKDFQTEFDTAIIRIDFPKKMPLIGHWIFYRKEDSSQYVD